MSTTRSLRMLEGPEPDENDKANESPGIGTVDRSDLPARLKNALKELKQLVTERAEAEAQARDWQSTNAARAETEYSRVRKGLVDKYVELERNARQEDESRRRQIVDSALAGEAKAKAEFASASRRISGDFDALRELARADYGRAKAMAAGQLESGNRAAANQSIESLKPVSDAIQLADSFRERLDAIATDYAKFKLQSEPPAASRESYDRFGEPVDELFNRLGRIESGLRLLEGLIIPKSMKGAREAWIFVVSILLMVGIALALDLGITGAAGLALTGLAVGGLARVWLAGLAKSQLERLYDPLRQSLADAEGLCAHIRAQIENRHADERRRLLSVHDEEQKRAKDEHARTIANGEARRDERLRQINESYARGMVDVQTRQAQEMQEAVADNARKLAEIPAQAEQKLARLDEEYKGISEKVGSRYESKWAKLSERWRDGMQRTSSEFREVSNEVQRSAPPWDDPAWPDRPLPRNIPSSVPMGSVLIDVATLPGGLSSDSRLREGLPTHFSLPAIRPFPRGANLLIETPPEGRDEALRVLQAQMFRLLTSLPPSMVRFTIVDPIGIGRNFGAFMHLADHDPALVTNQVWTDPRQIEERLAELEVHMETVTQKHLRNEYSTIEEYNAVAGEIAEPYRVLVIADFPTKFDEKSAGRLAALAASGVPCGVLILIAVDSSKALPAGFALSDLRPHCARLSWNGQSLVWDDSELGEYPLELEGPPPAPFATREIQRVGAAARIARRVEVPFSFIAPPEEVWWTGDSRGGIDVPLGKAAATKRQHLTLGQGTSQHALIAGRTGSGKSTLMHALIANLALTYSPDEIELCLIDFKKGVEFKVYATYALPHASVVAIESEREFGISVLQRLDEDLRLRADRFREAGVQDLNGYRSVPGTPPMPRVLLIVDEFQEFFVEEDKLAHEAALLLDRLVRQGRAFGIHILLGSQSLGGAFTLARSTLGQMAVRIALQCSEVDSLLILAENNLAAKWLSRPGEAIYNDTNGSPEGNHFFQVVWLSDEGRESYLKQIQQLAQRHPSVQSRKPIVFEGDATAELDRNPLLSRSLESPNWPESPRSASAWIGDAVAIKDPTTAQFRRQGGNHLLVVGQNEEAAFGITAACLFSLAVQYPPASSDSVRSGARFFVLDGTPEDHPRHGELAIACAGLPHQIKVGGWRDVPGFLAAVAGEVALRQQPEGVDGPEIFLFIHDLARFRDLRRREDDFGFNRREDEAAPPDHLDIILREGPGLGVHLVVWCDTVASLNRYFAHQQLREFEMRVLFQMSANDSGALLDSPIASKLGRNRAIFTSEEQNLTEKLRPYGPPSRRLIEDINTRLNARVARGG